MPDLAEGEKREATSHDAAYKKKAATIASSPDQDFGLGTVFSCQ